MSRRGHALLPLPTVRTRKGQEVLTCPEAKQLQEGPLGGPAPGATCTVYRGPRVTTPGPSGLIGGTKTHRKTRGELRAPRVVAVRTLPAAQGQGCASGCAGPAARPTAPPPGGASWLSLVPPASVAGGTSVPGGSRALLRLPFAHLASVPAAWTASLLPTSGPWEEPCVGRVLPGVEDGEGHCPALGTGHAPSGWALC